MLLQKRREHEQPPDSVNDAGDAREQLDGDADRAPQPHRAQLGQKYCDEQADRNGDQHRDDRRDDGAVDRRNGAEFFGDRIPGVFVEEANSKRAERGQRTPYQRDDDTAKDDQHRDGGSARQVSIRCVAQPQALQNLRPVHLLGDSNSRTLQRHVNHGRPPGRLHPALLGLFAAWEGHSSGLEAATQAACFRRWTRKGRRCGALSA